MLVMIVCLCANVSERKVIAAIEAGATSLRAIERRCGAGAGCGSCRGALRAYLARFREVGAIEGATERKPAGIELAPVRA